MATGDLRALTDEDLMALVDKGHARAFEVIFDRHASASFSLAYRMCGRRAIAEDIVHEAFLSVWRNGVRYDRASGSVRSLLLLVVHNRAIEVLRRTVASDSRAVADERAAERMPVPAPTDIEVARHDGARRVREALAELPPDQRQVIVLAYFGGFTHTQIAEMLELPTGTVKGWMRLGLSKMRVVLGPWTGASPPSSASSNEEPCGKERTLDFDRRSVA